VPISLRPARDRRPSSAGSEQLSERLRAELDERSRSSALTVTFVVALAFPAWAVLDRVLEPALAPGFLVERLLIEVPVLICLWLLWRRPVGRRRSALLCFLVLALVQADIAAMLVEVENVEFYLLGFSLPLYGSGVLLATRPGWTGALVVTSPGPRPAATPSGPPSPRSAERSRRGTGGPGPWGLLAGHHGRAPRVTRWSSSRRPRAGPPTGAAARRRTS
jgi:hypothetical protein